MEVTALATVILVLQSLTVSGKLIASFVMPHGGIALDPAHFNTTNATTKTEAWQLHNACVIVIVGQDIQLLKPDIIFLSTPHGVSDLRNFVFYLSARGQGTADTDNCQCPPCCYEVTVGLDANLSTKIALTLAKDGGNVSGISAFGPPGSDQEPFPLRWGEVIPLHFMPNLNGSRVIIMLDIGGKLFTILNSISERVVVIISSDLAHTHQSSGPYGFSNASEPFDLACSQWARTLHKAELTETAASYVDRALSCSFTGLVMLHGMLAGAPGGTAEWNPWMLANHHPSYYGMMVARFLRDGQHQC